MRVGVMGANGRMGRALIRAVSESEVLSLQAAIDRPDAECIGADSGSLAGIAPTGVEVVGDLASVIGQLDVLIDFTHPSVTVVAARLCAEHGVKMAIGTTGFSAEQEAVLSECAQKTGIVKATNMSIGMNLTFKLAHLAAKAFGDSVDIEIVEAHHRHKVDSPSGTALSLGHAVADGVGRDLNEVAIYGREGQIGPRERSTIGFATVRGGDVFGEHTVMYIGEGERLEITHRASSRDNWAAGAVRACEWLQGKLCGLYDMHDVLGLKDAE